MSLEALKTISQAEQEGKTAIANAQKDASDVISKATAEGEAAVKAETEKARLEVSHLIDAAVQKASESAVRLNEQTANRCAAITAHAEAKMDQAVNLIVERIVSS